MRRMAEGARRPRLASFHPSNYRDARTHRSRPVKVYDIALALVRVLVVVAVIRDLANFIIGAAGATYAFGAMWWTPSLHAMAGDAMARIVMFGRVLSTVLGIIVELIILAFAPRIARFAASVAGPAEPAGQA